MQPPPFAARRVPAAPAAGPAHPARPGALVEDLERRLESRAKAAGAASIADPTASAALRAVGAALDAVEAATGEIEGWGERESGSLSHAPLASC